MHEHLHEIIVLLAASTLAVPLFHVVKIEAILAYLCAGILIGPHAFRLISDPGTILNISELGVVLLLFLIGLELQPSRLWQLRYKVFGLGMMQVVVTGILLTLSGIALFGLSWQVAFVAGWGLALSSTAFAMQLLEDHRQLNTTHGQGSFSILLFQDLAVVPLIAIVPILSGANHTNFSTLALSKLLLIIGLFVVIGLYTVPYLLRFVARSRSHEVFIATSLLIVVGSAALMETVGLSMGTGAFLAGVLLANSEYRHELESNLMPFKGLFLGLFFIAIGMSLDLSVIFKQPLIVLGIVLGFMAVKIAVIYALGRLFRFPNQSARNMAFTLPQGGEFAFVLFTVAVASHVFDSQTQALLNAAVSISMVISPFLFNLNQKLRTYHELSEKPYDNIPHQDTAVIVAGYGRFGQIVTRFLKSQDIAFTILEHSASQVATARKFGAKIYYGDASRRDIVASAGAKDAKIFVLAIDDVAVSIATAKMIQKQFPHLEIIARARNRHHALELVALGIENIHRETYLTSLEVAKEVLLSLGRQRSEINGKLALFRQHDERLLREQLQYRDDEKDLISFTNKSFSELERILRADASSSKSQGAESAIATGATDEVAVPKVSPAAQAKAPPPESSEP